MGPVDAPCPPPADTGLFPGFASLPLDTDAAMCTRVAACLVATTALGDGDAWDGSECPLDHCLIAFHVFWILSRPLFDTHTGLEWPCRYRVDRGVWS